MNTKKVYRSNWHKKYLNDILLGLWIVILPFTIYLHLLFDGESNIITFFSLEIDHRFASNEVFLWIILKNVVPIVLFTTWFFTTEKKWKYLLFPLIGVFMYSILFNLEFILPNMEYSIAIIAAVFLAFYGLVIALDIKFFRYFRKSKMSASIRDMLDKEAKTYYTVLKTDVQPLLNKAVEKKSSFPINNVFYLKRKLDEFILRHEAKDSSSRKTERLLNISFVLVLVLSFLISNIHHFVPQGNQEIDLGFMVLDSNAFVDVNTYIWFLSTKLAVILPLSIWFLSAREWWKYAILSPFILYVYQFFEAAQDVKHLDSWGNIKAFPLILIIVLLLILLSETIRYRTGIMDVYDYVTDEVERLFKKLEGENRTNIKEIEIYQSLKNNGTPVVEVQKKRLYNLVQLRNDLAERLKSLG